MCRTSYTSGEVWLGAGVYKACRGDCGVIRPCPPDISIHISVGKDYYRNIESGPDWIRFLEIRAKRLVVARRCTLSYCHSLFLKPSVLDIELSLGVTVAVHHFKLITSRM